MQCFAVPEMFSCYKRTQMMLKTLHIFIIMKNKGWFPLLKYLSQLEESRSLASTAYWKQPRATFSYRSSPWDINALQWQALGSGNGHDRIDVHIKLGKISEEFGAPCLSLIAFIHDQKFSEKWQGAQLQLPCNHLLQQVHLVAKALGWEQRFVDSVWLQANHITSQGLGLLFLKWS